MKIGPFIFATVLLTTAWANADPSMPPTPLMRVDQAVGDLDKLSVSLRKIEPGLHQPSQVPALFVPVLKPTDAVSYTSPLAGPLPYYRMEPGFRARVDRLNYLIVTNREKHEAAVDITPVEDGHYFELIPPNLVYELNPYFPTVTTIDRQDPWNRPARTPEAKPPIDRRLRSLRIENQINRRVEPVRIDTRVSPQP